MKSLRDLFRLQFVCESVSRLSFMGQIISGQVKFERRWCICEYAVRLFLGSALKLFFRVHHPKKGRDPSARQVANKRRSEPAPPL